MSSCIKLLIFFVGYFLVFSDLLWNVSVNMVKKYRKSSEKLAVTIILTVCLILLRMNY